MVFRIRTKSPRTKVFGQYRLDKNHKVIVDELRYRGFGVISMAAVGGGVPDILVSTPSQTELIEIKVPGGKTNKLQKDFHEAWRGRPIHVVTRVEEVLSLFAPPRNSLPKSEARP